MRVIFHMSHELMNMTECDNSENVNYVRRMGNVDLADER
jgi:hypothetical protein